MSEKVHRAIKAHDLDTLARLLAAGDDPNERSTEQPQWSPLSAAIYEVTEGGDIEAVALLLRHGANCNAWEGNRDATPLLRALWDGHRDAALMLLAAGADPNVRSDVGDVPISMCVVRGDLKMAATLLRAGAAKTIEECPGDGTGCNALGHAAALLDIEMIRLLLAWGASITAWDIDRRTARERLPERTEENAEKYDLALELLSPKS
ncbi:MAG: ankyrin repeat domain-containing protein [Polyangiaceae bacterium]|nr:ankyrin repeat domain-containing protein [Polyangiaceae bacterium]